MLGAEKVTLVSSAYIQGEPLFKQFGRSLCRSKREGGLLLTLKVQFRGLLLDRQLPIIHLCNAS